MENLITDYLDPSSSDNESDNGFDNESVESQDCVLIIMYVKIGLYIIRLLLMPILPFTALVEALIKNIFVIAILK